MPRPVSTCLLLALSLTFATPSFPAVQKAIAMPNPEAHWSFDACGAVFAEEARLAVPTTSIPDDSRHGHLGTATGTLCVTGRIGTALRFDGIDDRVTVPHHPRFDANAALTLSAWVNPSSLTGPQTLINKWYAPDAWGLFLIDGWWVFAVAFPDGVWGRTTNVSAPAAVNVWTHLAATYDGSELALYFNGNLVDNVASPGLLQPSDRPILLGYNPDWNAFEGTLDEVRVYNHRRCHRCLKAPEPCATNV